jgi:hypothetical protein
METIEELVGEMRKDMPRVIDAKIILRNYADRIEAATKALEADRDNWREQAFAEASRANAATCKESLQVGNAAKMREALVQCELFLGNVSRHGHPTLNPGDKCTACDGADELRGMVARALAEPLRNCDVGTAEEQEERYIKLKREHVDKLARCPAEGYSFFPDSLYWAQMPYESSEQLKQTKTKESNYGIQNSKN